MVINPASMASQQQQPQRQGQRQRAPLSNGHHRTASGGPSTAVVDPEQQGRTVGSPGAYARDGRVNGYYRREQQYQHDYAGSDNDGELQNGEEEERFRDVNGDGARELHREEAGEEQDEQEPPVTQPQLSRHGFESPEEVLRELESRYFLYYTDVGPPAPAPVA